MGNYYNKCLSFTIMIIVMLAKLTSQNQTEEEPESGLVCISHCATCPAICSPPPPPSESHKRSSPPPPQTYFPSLSPPSPPKKSAPPPPPPPPSQSSPPPPSWYYVWGPSPPPYKNNAPPSGPGINVLSPTTTGARDYANPYYFVYASSSSTTSSSLVSIGALCFLFFINRIFLFQYL